MIKSIYGPITNPKTGESKDILVKVKPNDLKDILIGYARKKKNYVRKVILILSLII